MKDHTNPLARFKGHEDEVFCVSFSIDNVHLASGSNDKTVRVWNIDNKDCVVLNGSEDLVNTV